MVALYRTTREDIQLLEDSPDYFTTTDEQGEFKLEHLRQETYWIRTSDYKQQKLSVDPGTDAYGFLKTPVDLVNENLEHLCIPMVQADVTPLKIKETGPQGPYFTIGCSKPIVHYSLTLAQIMKWFRGDASLYSHLLPDNKTVHVYNTWGLLEEDSLQAKFVATDSLGESVEGDITLRFREEESKENPPSCKMVPAADSPIPAHYTGEITVNKPVKQLCREGIYFVVHGKERIPLEEGDVILSPHRDKLTISKSLPVHLLSHQAEKTVKHEDVGVVLHIEEGALVTIEDEEIPLQKYRYVYKEPKEYGSIRGHVTTSAPGFIIQLVDEKEKVVQEIRHAKDYQLKGILPGKYTVRVLLLSIREGEWCCGNIHQKKEPDPVWVYPEEVEVAANWEVEHIDFPCVEKKKQEEEIVPGDKTGG